MKLLLLLCCLLGVCSAWTQPNTCYVRQATGGVEGELRQIREMLATSGMESRETFQASQAMNQATLEAIQTTLEVISTTFSQLVDVLSRDTNCPSNPLTTTAPSESTNTAAHTFESTTVVTPTTDKSTTVVVPTTDETTTVIMPTTDESTTIVMPTTDETTTVDMPTTDESTTVVTPTTDESTTVVTPTTDATPPETCGGPGWTQVAFLNMSDPSETCPQGLSETSYSIRGCGRSHSGSFDCSSVTFPANGAQYSQVCGRAKAYRWGDNNAFYGYHIFNQDIDGAYVDGLSLTQGSPRAHIWTFASGQFNGTAGDTDPFFRCPCAPGNTYKSPSFVGDHFFCESVATADNWDINRYRFYPDNPLWDGQGCQGNDNTCCLQNNPPWFMRNLIPTTDDIELRMCFLVSEELQNIALNFLELYIK